MAEDETCGVIGHIETGDVVLDTLTNGGFIDGMVNVLYGPEDCGKTTLLLNTFAHTQKKYGFFNSYFNQEKSFRRDYALKRGIDPEMLEVQQFKTTDQALDKLSMAATGEAPVDLAVIDTLQALSPAAELETKAGKEKSVSDDTMALIIAQLSRN